MLICKLYVLLNFQIKSAHSPASSPKGERKIRESSHMQIEFMSPYALTSQTVSSWKKMQKMRPLFLMEMFPITVIFAVKVSH